MPADPGPERPEICRSTEMPAAGYRNVRDEGTAPRVDAEFAEPASQGSASPVARASGHICADPDSSGAAASSGSSRDDDLGAHALSGGPVIIGRPIFSFEPRPVRRSAYELYRPDTIVDGWATDSFLVRCSSLRGYLHRWDGTPRQDDLAVAVHETTGVLLAAVADGLSSAPLSHIGATWACFHAVDWLNRQLDAGMSVAQLPWEELLTAAAMALVEYATGSTQGPGASVDVVSRQLATTLVAAAIVPHRNGMATAHMIGAGDSGAWMLRGGRFTPVMSQKLGDADEITDSSVSFPLPQLSSVAPTVSRVLLSPDDVLLIGSDGFGDPLGSGGGQVGSVFAQELAQPPTPLAFASLLDFSRENYDDDRTLIAIWPLPPS